MDLTVSLITSGLGAWIDTGRLPCAAKIAGMVQYLLDQAAQDATASGRVNQKVLP
jgi:hypothetical protein